MDMEFDVKQVFQDRLASSMGLDKYQYIMDNVRKRVPVHSVPVLFSIKCRFPGDHEISCPRYTHIVTKEAGKAGAVINPFGKYFKADKKAIECIFEVCKNMEDLE